MSPTLAQRVEAACDQGSITFVGPGSPDIVPWARLHQEARAMAGALQARGVQPGDHVALLGPTSRALVTALQAVWLAGAAVVTLPLPLRLGSLVDFVDQTRARLARADARLVLVDPTLAQLVALAPAAGDPPMVGLDQLLAAGAGSGFEAPAPDPSSLAIIQFTSGSTADPKGVMLPHAQVGANVAAITACLDVHPGQDVAVSWLPLYHDMGLIGMLIAPMCAGVDLVLGAPQDFMAAPGRWLEWMSTYHGTLTAGPNFGYALATRAMARSGGIDLSSWRVALNGAEPIDPAVVEHFCQVGQVHGLDHRVPFCVYGLAEATLAVTFPALSVGLTVDAVDRRTLEMEAAAVPAQPGLDTTRRLARLGRPIGDLEIRVVEAGGAGSGGAGGRLRGEREVGELEIRGSSVTTGYYRNPAATADAFTSDGWLRTGDLAYLADGELVVCGRSKDMIIVGGRNVYPEDVERAVAGVPGVRAGNVIAFGVDTAKGREGLVVVAETRDADPGALRRAVAERVRHSVGLPARDIVLVGPGSLPKTSSGKLQRDLCRQRYLASELVPA